YLIGSNSSPHRSRAEIGLGRLFPAALCPDAGRAGSYFMKATPSTWGKPLGSAGAWLSMSSDPIVEVGTNLGRRENDGFDAGSVQPLTSRSRGFQACP